MQNKLTKTLFSIYIFALFWILLLKLGVRFSYMENRRINLIPFGDPMILNGKPDIGEIILNILIFIPLGVYGGILFKNWTWRRKILSFFSLSLLFETLQYILKIGAFDITDIITNTSGGIIGLLCYHALELLLNSSIKTQKLINIVSTIATLTMVTLLVLLKLNMLPIRYQ